MPARYAHFLGSELQLEWAEKASLETISQPTDGIDADARIILKSRTQNLELEREREKNRQLEARLAKLEETIASWTKPPVFPGTDLREAVEVEGTPVAAYAGTVEVTAESEAKGVGAAIVEGAVGAVASRFLGEKAKLLTETGRGAKMEELLSEL